MDIQKIRIGNKLFNVHDFDIIELDGECIYFGLLQYDGMNTTKAIFKNEQDAYAAFDRLSVGEHSPHIHCEIESWISLFGVRGRNPWEKDSKNHRENN